MPQGLPTQKCSLRSSSINLTWKMVRNAESRAPPQLYRLRISKFPGESHTLKWDKMNGKIFYYVLTKALWNKYCCSSHRGKIKVQVRSGSGCRSDPSDSLRPHGSLCPWNSLGKNTEVGYQSLLQGIFPTQGLNPGLLHCRQILHCRFFTIWAISRLPRPQDSRSPRLSLELGLAQVPAAQAWKRGPTRHGAPPRGGASSPAAVTHLSLESADHARALATLAGCETTKTSSPWPHSPQFRWAARYFRLLTSDGCGRGSKDPVSVFQGRFFTGIRHCGVRTCGGKTPQWMDRSGSHWKA